MRRYSFCYKHYHVTCKLPQRAPDLGKPLQLSAKEKEHLTAKMKSSGKNSKGMTDKKGGDNDDVEVLKCPDDAFPSMRTGQCKFNVVMPDTINTAYGVSSNVGFNKASQGNLLTLSTLATRFFIYVATGILSMIDDVVSPADLLTFQKKFGLPETPIQYLVGVNMPIPTNICLRLRTNIYILYSGLGYVFGHCLHE